MSKEAISKSVLPFRSPEYAARFMAAYEAVLKKWPVPFEELNIHTSFGNTHVIANGPKAAQPVVLLPPGGTYAPMWIRNVESLSRAYRTYAVDILGEVNKSVPLRPIRGSREFMDWMQQLLDGLLIDRADLIGNSHGGFHALETALYLPERVRKLVLISPCASIARMPRFWFRLFIPSYFIAPLFKSESMVRKAYDWLWQDFPMEDDFARLKRISKVAGVGYRPSINRGAPRVFSDEELRRVRVPVLLLIGDHEVIYKPEVAIRRATRLIPNLKTVIVPNANHSAQYTAPDFVNKKILEFLSHD
jgi:pimeloyl-ACP methyl ester carboxylesterase